jgi:hypothetical protein
MAIFHIAGDWSENGFLAGRDLLTIEVQADGSITDPVDDMPISFQQWGRDCPIITNGCWEFMVDTSEMTRIGLVPTQMAGG